MKAIGLLGGMSWESSAVYYRVVNQQVRERLGGLHSARCIVNSVDFHGLEELMRSNRWDEVGERLAAEARNLERAGADVLLLCSGSMHKVARQVSGAANIPFIHIADPVGEAVVAAGIKRVGLLATRYTMEQDFYRGRLAEKYGVEAIIPDEPLRSEVHRVVFEELVLGDIRATSRETYRGAIKSLVSAGAEGVILGCTEIPLLIGPGDSAVPVLDGTELHARAAVDFALA